ncbi:heptosyltransferase-2 [Winogradskyella epiphytica]|uniref:Heptosyltransferase-2 n=1 Tax=Winogradskyella epiphytica TaxID=262005 RepID=A0A2V4XE45_9FLAO|nr:glycosyltransferase family 9 protein [Winogradskyella epiphytica]PYE81015.1 heptosyltransferase-2 [Winogradskyella epiphytica]GGW66229.1 heptosyltransferase [Winogradskyella epiphytica]
MKVLIIQQKRIGDVLTTSILANILKKNYPDASIDYLCYSYCVDVLKENPSIDKIVVLEEVTRKNYWSLLKFINRIRREEYTIVIDAYSKLETNLITGFSGAKYKISYHKGYSNIFYNHNIKRLPNGTNSKNGLAIDNRLALLEPILKTKNIKDYKPKIFLSQSEIETAKLLLNKHDINTSQPVFMIGILGSEWYKTYPLESMAKLLDFIAKETKASLLFNYIPNQKEDALKLYNLCNQYTQEKIYFELYATSLRGFLGLLSQCDALIGNEGGSVNMAKALDVPTFSLFSPSVDKETWQIFEDDKNISIHLKDLKPEIFEEHDEKYIKEHTMKYFDAYPISKIKEKLSKFLITTLKSNN